MKVRNFLKTIYTLTIEIFQNGFQLHLIFIPGTLRESGRPVAIKFVARENRADADKEFQIFRDLRAYRNSSLGKECSFFVSMAGDTVVCVLTSKSFYHYNYCRKIWFSSSLLL